MLERRPELLASMVQECRSMAKGLQDHEQNAGINDVKISSLWLVLVRGLWNPHKASLTVTAPHVLFS